MIELIGVRFKKNGKVYSFSPNGLILKVGDLVITETAHGTECGEVAIANQQVAKEEVPAPLKPILRKTTKEDLRILENNRKKEARAFQVCEEKIKLRNLLMWNARLTTANCSSTLLLKAVWTSGNW